jgi:hypothetical protein
VVLGDVLMTSDDGRAALALHAIAEFSKGSQAILFTHHAHLLDVAERTVRALGRLIFVISPRRLADGPFAPYDDIRWHGSGHMTRWPPPTLQLAT